MQCCYSYTTGKSWHYHFFNYCREGKYIISAPKCLLTCPQTTFKLIHQARINVCDKSFLQSMFPHAFEREWLLYRDKAITPRHTSKHTHRSLEVRAGSEAAALLLGLMPGELCCHRSPIQSLVLTPNHIFILTKKKKVIKWSLLLTLFALQILPALIVTLRFNRTSELWILFCYGVSSCWSFSQLQYFSNYYMFISKHQRKYLLLISEHQTMISKKN